MRARNGITMVALAAVIAAASPAVADAMGEGWAAWRAGDYELAAGRFEAAADEQPGRYEPLYAHGIARRMVGEPERAVVLLSLALEARPGELPAELNLVRALLESGRAQEALDVTAGTVERHPGSAEAWHLRGRAFLELKPSGEEAVAALERSVGVDEENGYAWNTLGLALIRQGRYEEAIEPLENAAVLLSEIPYVRNNLGVAYERSGRLEDAAAEYGAAAAAGHAGAELNRARVDRLLGNHNEDGEVPESREAVTLARKAGGR